MIIIEKNLEQLIDQFSICDRNLADDFSIRVQLGPEVFDVNNDGKGSRVVYGSHPDPSTLFSPKRRVDQNLVLCPGQQVIACSNARYKMPVDYFGLVQTKGTLARLFVQATCNDGQIEPGFEGFITLEIVNFSPWVVEIPVGADVAQIYLFKSSSVANNAYAGRYSEGAKSGPTLALFQPVRRA